LETPVRQSIEKHAGSACIERNRGALFCDMELPLLGMREVSLCHPDLASPRQNAFNRQTGAFIVCPQLPAGRFRKSKRTPETAVWVEDMVPRKTASKRSSHATRARKSNHQPSHIDDWMYAKLAGLRLNVNENRVRNALSGGFLSKKPISGLAAHPGRPTLVPSASFP